MRNCETPQRVVGIVSKNPQGTALLSNSLRGRNIEALGYKDTKQLESFLNVSPLDMIILSARTPITPRIAFIPRVVLGTGEKGEVVSVLDNGACDYIVTTGQNPKDVADYTAAKVMRLLNRTRKPQAEPLLAGGEISVDVNNSRLTIDGQQTEIGSAALKILAHLMEHTGMCFSAKELQEFLGLENHKSGNSYISTMITYIRSVLGDDNHIPYIRGKGYTFNSNPNKSPRI